jgi:hypothetical protein
MYLQQQQQCEALHDCKSTQSSPAAVAGTWMQCGGVQMLFFDRISTIRQSSCKAALQATVHLDLLLSLAQAASSKSTAYGC